MWVYRRISWREHITNVKVHQKMNTEQTPTPYQEKNIEFNFGHAMRNEKYKFLNLVVQGKTQKKELQSKDRHRGLKLAAVVWQEHTVTVPAGSIKNTEYFNNDQSSREEAHEGEETSKFYDE